MRLLFDEKFHTHNQNVHTQHVGTSKYPRIHISRHAYNDLRAYMFRDTHRSIHFNEQITESNVSHHAFRACMHVSSIHISTYTRIHISTHPRILVPTYSRINIHVSMCPPINLSTYPRIQTSIELLAYSKVHTEAFISTNMSHIRVPYKTSKEVSDVMHQHKSYHTYG